MIVDHIPCGPYANESEKRAVELIKSKLSSLPGDGRWVLLSNLSLAMSSKGVPEEIDLVAIGPQGVFVIEIKHWQKSFLKANVNVVDAEATKLNNKVRKIISRVRKIEADYGFLGGSFLVTNESSKFGDSNRPVILGSKFYTNGEWKELLDVDRGARLSNSSVRAIAKALEPKIRSTLDGNLRRIGRLINLELVSPKDDRFHRVFKGQHTLSRDKVVVHLYDASAFDGKDAEKVISREFTVLQRLQKFSCVPRIMDSHQAMPDYPGELFFFSIADPSAPMLSERVNDQYWDTNARRLFAKACCESLKELHEHQVDGKQHFVHRNISNGTLLVTSQNRPIFVGFHLSKTASTGTIAKDLNPSQENLEFQAPEVVNAGLSVADQRSDIFSLCATLKYLFDPNDSEFRDLFALFDLGASENPDQRPTLAELINSIDEIAEESHKELPLPEPRYWSEGLLIPFRGKSYEIVSRIGSGSFGTTFKVVEIDPTTKETYGTYLGKIVYDAQAGEKAISAYRRARSHTNTPRLSTIFDFPDAWSSGTFVSLMEWVEGNPLAEWIELVEPYSEELKHRTAEHLVIEWLEQACEALASLHKVGLVHGDVSLKNIIESQGDLVLTDFDSVQQIGAEGVSAGTAAYSAEFGGLADASRDIFALGASFFHLLWGEEPFNFNGVIKKDRGLNWENVEPEGFPTVCEFLRLSTNAENSQRFKNALDAVEWLKEKSLAIQDESLETAASNALKAVTEQINPKLDVRVKNSPTTSLDVLTNNTVEWLLPVLQSYPGSQHGNTETRGLDTDFARQTFVETQLEAKLLNDIKAGQVNLIILCGNAGDGKTAFLQNLAIKLGLEPGHSSQRVWKTKIGVRNVMANLDGSASYQGKSSEELLNEIFQPFHTGMPNSSQVHLVAVNDGRLMEWVTDYEEQNGDTRLTTWIWETLSKQPAENLSHIRLIDLNNRSLVGGYDANTREFTTTFVDKLVNKLTCSERFHEVWAPCKTCSASTRCTAYKTVSLLNDDRIDEVVIKRGARARSQLYSAFQAVHQRGDIHITARELRSALSYIVFGIYHCADLHNNPDLRPGSYFDRAFDSNSELRQGDLLTELALFDPSLESHPHIDRYLKSSRPLRDGDPVRYPNHQLSSARRRAYFEWKPKEIELIGGNELALTIARGKYVELFRRVPKMNQGEKQQLRDRLLKGISRLENLPRLVLSRAEVTPLKVTPRTPVETFFWIDKPNERFTLEAEQAVGALGYETLHRYISLTYHYESNNIETLHMNSELFYTLLELGEGFQLSDAFSADTFAHLSVFTQRLGQENERSMFAWNPSQEHVIHQLVGRDDGDKQVLKLVETNVKKVNRG